MSGGEERRREQADERQGGAAADPSAEVIAATLEALQARVAPEDRDALRGAAPEPGPGEG